MYSLSNLLYTGFSYTPSIILRILFCSTSLPKHFLTVVIVAISEKSDVTKTVPGSADSILFLISLQQVICA